MTADAPDAADAVEHAELTTFKSQEGYVYKVPPSSTIGHRAELWDVDHWLQARPIPSLVPLHYEHHSRTPQTRNACKSSVYF